MSKREKAKKKVKSEPAAVRGFVVAALALLAHLGVEQASDVDVSLATTGLVALIAVGQGLWTRFAVSPAEEPTSLIRKFPTP